MRDTAIELVQFRNYARLLYRLIPELVSIAAYHSDGELVWKDDSTLGDHTTIIRGWLNPPSGEMTGQERSFQSRKLENGQVLHSFWMNDGAGKHAGVVGLLVAAPPEAASERSGTPVDDVLHTIVSCINNEYRLNSELSFMADELGERYEELNLVYETDDRVSMISKGQEAMQELVISCIDFLDVGMVSLILPEKKVVIFSVNRDDPIADHPKLLATAKGPLGDWVREHRQPVVINDVTDPVRDQVCPDTHYKLIAVPIEAGERESSGTLAVFNQGRKPDFTNSDRNLVSVVAKKVARIILSSFDPLTGMTNLHNFQYHLQQALIQAQTRGLTHSLLNIDLDQLQIINDICGWQAGNQLIQQAAIIIQDQVRDQDMVARIDGDEFGVLLQNCPLEIAVRIATRIQEKIRKTPLEWEGMVHEVSAGIGVAPVSAGDESFANAMSSAEMARNAAKERGRSKLQVYTADDLDLLKRKDQMQWVSRIQSALRENRFQIYAQPIVALQPDTTEYHYETLLRLSDEKGELLSPGAFIPAAEHFYLMPEIDRWVVDQVLKTLGVVWPGLEGESVKIAINLSGQSIGDDSFQEFLLDRLQNSPVPEDTLCFEITETAAISNLVVAKELISRLKQNGCSVSLDDFGSGLSSFTYLKNLDVDYLKIDGSFVKEIETDEISKAMVSAIHQIGHVMGLKTIAEWVENETIEDALRKMGVDFGQGFGLGRPAPLMSQLSAIVDAGRCKVGRRVG